MQALQQKAKELLESGRVKVVIGYGNGSGNRIRPVFISKVDNCGELIWDDRCRQNLAVYLNKSEIRNMGAPALVATPAVVKTVIQLIAENQIESSDIILLVNENGTIAELTDNASLEMFSSSHPVLFPPFVNEEIKKLGGMSIPERFQFWQDELSRCFKCYACRAACPLCYCERCITDNNQPQWVCVASHAQGNFEWHMNRAMHLAGRCIECGSCTIACPVGIPIGLLTIEASRIVKEDFSFQPGLQCNAAPAMSSFKVEDTETFIQ